jgi:hypothetical protein
MSYVQPTDSTTKWKVRLRKWWPLLLWLGFSGGTVLLFEVGPFVYDVPNLFFLLLYLIAAHAAVILGFRSGCESRALLCRVSPIEEKTTRIIAILGCIALISIAVAVADDLSRGLSLTHVIEDPLGSRDAWQDENNLGMRYIDVLLGAATLPFIGLGIYAWRNCGRSIRVLVSTVLVMYSFHAVIGASRATFFALGCVFTIALSCCIASGRMKVKPVRWAIISLSLLIALLLYSSFIAQSRGGSVIEDYAEFASENFDTRPEVIGLIEKLPPVSQAAILQGAYYFTHSYKYLARCLDMDYAGSTYGLGFSRFLTRTYTKLSGSDALERRVYFERLVLEDRESPGIWCTGYAWIASDWTFPGSLIVLFILGRWLAQSWRESVAGLGIAAVPVMCWTFFIAVMLPIDCALSDYGALISFAVSLTAWKAARRLYLDPATGARKRPGLQHGIPLRESGT